MTKRARSAAAATSGSLGDIMGGSSRQQQSPIRQPIDHFDPMHRIVLSANGNLQRIVSSYYNSQVLVTTRRSEETSRHCYERHVELSVFGTVFCVARSVIKLTRPDVIEAVKKGVAIGQLFRHLNIMPVFELIGASFEEDESKNMDLEGAVKFWREYTLENEGIHCRIKETLRKDLFCLEAREHVNGDAKPSAPPPSLGDIMSPGSTHLELPDGFSPMERILLTANGNIERMVSSYHASPVSVYLMSNHKRHDAPVYDRQVIYKIRCQHAALDGS